MQPFQLPKEPKRLKVKKTKPKNRSGTKNVTVLPPAATGSTATTGTLPPQPPYMPEVPKKRNP